MCGIAAYIGKPNPDAPLATWRMLRAQRHRGPDGVGIATPKPGASWHVATAPDVIHLDVPVTGAPRAVLGHNWLAIQDPAPHAAQPMADDNLALTFNGEIYNFIELRDELARRGVNLTTGSDTEVLLALWRLDAEACLPKLRGMFAFVVHDAASGRTWCVRDPFGIKPLYLARLADATLIASEIRALHATTLLQRRMRESSVLAAVAGGINTFGERATLYEGVEELSAGHVLRIEPDGTTHETTFASLPALTSDLSGDDAIDALRAELERSVEIHLRSSRALATCLSGGLDSTNLAWIIGRRLDRPDLDTFTILSDELASPEVDRASDLAHAAGLRHHVRRHLREIPFSDVVDMIVACETPNHVIGPINQFLLLREIANHGAAVVLDGQGADELLSGYPWYTPLLLDALRARTGDASNLAQACAQHRPMPDQAFDNLTRAFSSPGAWVRQIMGAESFLGISADEVARLDESRSYLDDHADWSTFRERTYKRGELAILLRQEDRLGMWHGLECRVPYVDMPLVGVGARIDPQTLIAEGYLKHPLRVLYPEMPEQIRFSLPKHGFWRTRLDRFPWLNPISWRLVRDSEVLHTVFPNLRDGLSTLRPQDRIRIMQIAVLERAADRAESAELIDTLSAWHADHVAQTRTRASA